VTPPPPTPPPARSGPPAPPPPSTAPGSTTTQAAPASISTTEGAAFSGQVAALTAQCANPSSPEATIAWGDSTPDTAASVTDSGSQLSIDGSSTYGEEGRFGGTVTGSYNCPGALAPSPVTFEASFNTSVADGPLTITTAPTLAAGVTAGHGFAAQIAQFSDADPAGTADDYTATVSWGDGTTSTGTIVPAGSGLGVSATHSYATAGSYTAEVRIDDLGGAGVTATVDVQVEPGPARVGLRVEPHVGNGTTVLLLNPNRPGALTIFPVRRHHRLLIAGRSIRVGRAGPVVVVLDPTAAARLLPHDEALSAKVKIRFNPLTGSGFTQWASILVDDLVYCGSMTYYFTGSEQSCIVPKGVHAVKVIAVGGRGGNVSYGNFGGSGGRGALVVDPELPVTPGQTLYIEVGGNGGDVYATHEALYGSAGAGGWNGGGPGGLPSSGIGGGGGGGASDVQTLSCAQLCDPQSLGFGTLIALHSRLVIAAGGGGAGSGGSDGAGGDNQGGNGGDAVGDTEWGGSVGGDASQFNGQGGQGGFGDSGGAGGDTDPSYDGSANAGADGMVGAGGAGGADTDSLGENAGGFAGGGGGGGWAGGGGGGAGFLDQNNTIGAGGGGGAGSSYGQAETTAVVNVTGELPHIQIIPLG
jgi:hypothetical protein